MTSENVVLQGVVKDLEDRADEGIKKYGQYLHQNGTDNMLQHAYEEALDLAMYLKTELLRQQREEEVMSNLPLHLGDYL